MSCAGEDRAWICGRNGTVNLQGMGSLVRDISDPCLSQSPLKVNKMLKPDKWEAAFDGDGKPLGFRKALKLILLGGVDPSIRAEVWEFLLGCFALSSTAEYRRQLRVARRAHYEDLIKQCQRMHSRIGTGSLAFVVGSKVMDVRTSSKDDGRRDSESESREAFVDDMNYESKSREASDDNMNYVESFRNKNENDMCKSYSYEQESSSDSADIVSFRGSADSGACSCSCFEPTSGPCKCSSLKLGSEGDRSQFVTENYFDFPPLPVTDLFDNREVEKECLVRDSKLSTQCKLRFEDESMHSFHINNNEDIILDTNGSSSNNVFHQNISKLEMVHLGVHDPELQFHKSAELVNRLRISDAPETEFLNASTSHHNGVNEERVSEWLWTLHRIVVDVVRTDSHLEFYEDTRNLARMSDILAVYAWIDPATGYCQGMSDLLSPFIVLFEDNADAFWCFEMLIRRLRENFQMEGPTGVMKQLQALWHILELTDREMFVHLSHIGAESLHFAFRMLLVLFRRELSFQEALCMWEMMWAADFDESMASNLENNCPQPLIVQLPRASEVETSEETNENVNDNVKGDLQSTPANIEHSKCDNVRIKPASAHPFCGLTRNFWSRHDHDHMQMCPVVSSRKINDELPVFCVAAILILNRRKIIREAHSIDDMIKIFNDRKLKINVIRCIRTAIKLRKKYLYKDRCSFNSL